MRAHIPQQEWLNIQEDTLAVLGLGFSNSLGGLTQMKFTFDRYRWPVYSLFPERIVTNRHHTGVRVTYAYIRVHTSNIRVHTNQAESLVGGGGGGEVGGQGKLKETNPFRKVRLLTCAFSFHFFLFFGEFGVEYSYVPVCQSYVLVCYSYVPLCTRMFLVCYSYVTRMYSYVTRILLVCTRMLLVCTRIYPYVTRMYPYVTRMLPVWYISHDPLEDLKWNTANSEKPASKVSQRQTGYLLPSFFSPTKLLPLSRISAE